MQEKKIILLSDTAVILYSAGSRTVLQDRHMKYTLSAGTYSIGDFNGKYVFFFSKSFLEKKIGLSPETGIIIESVKSKRKPWTYYLELCNILVKFGLTTINMILDI